MFIDQQFRGRQYSIAASLVFFLSGEVLKWQFPALAASEKLSQLVAILCPKSFPSALELIRR